VSEDTSPDNTGLHLFRGEAKASGEMQDLIDAACYANAWNIEWKAIEHEMCVEHPDGTVITTHRRVER
jgi:hypothetical protein